MSRKLNYDNDNDDWETDPDFIVSNFQLNVVKFFNCILFRMTLLRNNNVGERKIEVLAQLSKQILL